MEPSGYKGHWESISFKEGDTNPIIVNDLWDRAVNLMKNFSKLCWKCLKIYVFLFIYFNFATIHRFCKIFKFMTTFDK